MWVPHEYLMITRGSRTWVPPKHIVGPAVDDSSHPRAIRRLTFCWWRGSMWGQKLPPFRSCKDSSVLHIIFLPLLWKTSFPSSWSMLGYEDHELFLKLGYNREVLFTIPHAVCIFCFKPNIICCTGVDKDRVHQFAGAVRSCTPPEVYKGKEVLYIDEITKLKPGKKQKKWFKDKHLRSSSRLLRCSKSAGYKCSHGCPLK
jgi:large subunit ribosomal protein L6